MKLAPVESAAESERIRAFGGRETLEGVGEVEAVVVVVVVAVVSVADVALLLIFAEEVDEAVVIVVSVDARLVIIEEVVESLLEGIIIIPKEVEVVVAV